MILTLAVGLAVEGALVGSDVGLAVEGAFVGCDEACRKKYNQYEMQFWTYIIHHKNQ